jgi:hypothetical protein
MDSSHRIRLSWNLLRYSYGVVILLVGLDKIFGTNLIVDWPQYISAFVLTLLPVSLPVFLVTVGIIEVIVALIMLMKSPRIAGYISIVWLVVIAINLLMAGYVDVAVRDLLLAVGAFVLAELTTVVHGQKNA